MLSRSFTNITIQTYRMYLTRTPTSALSNHCPGLPASHAAISRLCIVFQAATPAPGISTLQIQFPERQINVGEDAPNTFALAFQSTSSTPSRLSKWVVRAAECQRELPCINSIFFIRIPPASIIHARTCLRNLSGNSIEGALYSSHEVFDYRLPMNVTEDVHSEAVNDITSCT